MAYVQNQQTDDEDEKTSASGTVAPAGGGAVHLAPSSGVGVAGNAGTPAAGSPSAGGNFATLDKYVSANAGRAGDIANNITSGVQQQYNTLNNQNTQTIQGIQGDVNNGYTAYDPNLLSQEAANPVSFASNGQNVSGFQKQANDAYTGPTNAENDARYQTQQANINDAIAQGQAATQTEAGREGLLQQTERRPTAGVTALNSALLSADPNAQGTIENAYKPFQNLVSGLSTGAQGIDQNISQAQSDAQKASTQANTQIVNQVNALNSSLTNTVNADQTALNNYNAQIPTLQAQYAPLEEGIKAATSGTGYNFTDPLTKFLGLQQVQGTPTAANAATADQYTQAGAFNSLLAGLNGAPSPIISAGTAAQAGTAPIAPTLPTAPSVNDTIQNLAQQLGTLEKSNPAYTKGYGATGMPANVAAAQQFASLLQQLQQGDQSNYDNSPYYKGFSSGYSGQ